jgi:hypothetical protein
MILFSYTPPIEKTEQEEKEEKERRHNKRDPRPLPERKDPWAAPEHWSASRNMESDFPRDVYGRRIYGRERQLKIDRRPAILVPPRQTYPGML